MTMPTDILPVPRETRESAILFKSLGDPGRLHLLAMLAAEGEMFVGQICERSTYTQPAISSQLKILRFTGLVEVRREGAKLFYSIAGGFEGIADRVQTAVDSIRKSSLKAPKTKRRPT
jgi:ArsR family transcriptional regulator, lead/cadmium/zinc/bismuth-responsive transcriptional repressor